MFETSTSFAYNEFQTSFRVFENSLENVFVYDSDWFPDFWLQLINSLRRIRVCNIFYVSQEVVVTGSQVRVARRTWNRSTSSHPNVLLLHYIVRGWTILLEDHAFWILSELGEQKIRKYSFAPTSCHISVFKKVRSDYFPFILGGPFHNWRGILKRLRNLFRAFSSPHSEILLVYWSRKKKFAFIGEPIISFPGTQQHF